MKRFPLRRDAPTSVLRLNISNYVQGRTPRTDGTGNPWRGNVERFPLQVPPLHIHNLFRLFRQSYYDYAKELMLAGWGDVSYFQREITEIALVHFIGDKAEQASKRRAGEAAQADGRMYCETKKSENVIQIANRNAPVKWGGGLPNLDSWAGLRA